MGEETKSYHIACSTWLEDYGYEAGLCQWDERVGLRDPYNTARCKVGADAQRI